MPQAPSPFSVAGLLAPMEPARFLGQHFERSPFFLTRKQPDFYGDLLSVEDIEQFVVSNIGQVAIVNAAEADGRKRRLEDQPRNTRIDTVLSAFHDGCSMVLDGMHRHHPGLRALCLALQAETQFRFQTNIYVTPPTSRAFRLHFDSHDVFVLQTRGKKRWDVDRDRYAMPVDRDHYDGPEEPEGRRFQRRILHQGDLLYIPRGFLHRADSVKGEVSIHITLGFHVPKWSDFMRFAGQAAIEENEALRSAFPIRAAGRDADLSPFAEALARMGEPAFMERAAADFAQTWRDSLQADFSDRFTSAVTVLEGAAAARFSGNRHLNPSLSTGESGLVIRLIDKKVTFPVDVREAVEFCLEGRNYRLADVPLPQADARVLVERMVQEGLVTATAGPPRRKTKA